MILYKYVSRDVGLEYFIKNQTLKFTSPANLNDPFETSAHKYSEDENGWEILVSSDIGVINNYGILSLTRNPSNSLMWSHYANGERYKFDTWMRYDLASNAHGGFVIGIDAPIQKVSATVNS